jgi:hypothetical protein
MHIIFRRRGMWDIPRPATSGWHFLTDWGIDEEDRRATVEMTSSMVRRRAKTNFMLLLYVDLVTSRLLVNLFEAKFCEKACEQNTNTYVRLAASDVFDGFLVSTGWYSSGDDSTGTKTSTPGSLRYDSYVAAYVKRYATVHRLISQQTNRVNRHPHPGQADRQTGRQIYPLKIPSWAIKEMESSNAMVFTTKAPLRFESLQLRIKQSNKDDVVLPVRSIDSIRQVKQRQSLLGVSSAMGKTS